MYRKYDDLPVPGGDPARFDVDAARRADPVSSGRYAMRDDAILVQLGPPPQPECLTARLAGEDLMIGSTRYERQ